MAQVISYEIKMGLIIIRLIVWVGTFSLFELSLFQSMLPFFFSQVPLFFMWVVTSLAETKRAPFDLTEGESELVSGYNVEYSGAPFALFFIAEYSKIIFIKFLTVILFFGVSLFSFFLIFFIIKVLFFIFIFLWVRASFPRFRYDHLMYLT